MPTLVVRPAALSRQQRDQMFALLSRFFSAVRRDRFEADLAEKDWVLLLTSPCGTRIDGFSSLAMWRTEVRGQQVCALFSGDSVIAQDRWGESGLPRAVTTLALDTARRQRDQPVYWLILTCAFRAFHTLAALFQNYHPSIHGAPAIREKEAIDALVRLKFKDEYDAEAGVVSLREPTPYRSDLGEIPARFQSSPLAEHFSRGNPHYRRGDYLVCWTQLSHSNLTAIGRRLVGLPRCNPSLQGVS